MMSGPSQALILRFGGDATQLRSVLSALASEAPRMLAQIAQASIASSATLRNSLIAAGAEGTKTVSAQLISLASNMDNLKLASGVAGEAIKTAFVIHHPVLAIGLRLLNDYKAALGLVAAGALTAHEALALMSAQFAEINHIIEASEKAGVSGTLFQAWTQQAAHLRLTVQEAEEAITSAGRALERQLNPISENQGSLSRRADYIANFDGPSAGREALANARTLDDMHQAALLLVRDYQQAADEAQRQGLALEAAQRNIDAARIATEVWGEAGKKIAESIRDGSLNVDAFIQKSKDAGNVWSDEILAAQRDVNKELTEARAHLSDEMKPSLEILERLTLSLVSAWAHVVEAIARAAHGVNSLASAIASIPPLPFIGGLLSGETTARMREMADALKNDTHGKPFREAFAKELSPPIAISAAAPPRRPDDLGVVAPRAGRGGGGSSAAEQQDQVDRYIRSLERENAALEGEAAALGKSAIERQKSIDLAKAEAAAKERGRDLTDEERQKIESLAEAHVTLKKRVDDAARAKQQFDDAMRSFATTGESAFEKLIVDGQKFSDVLRGVARDLERAALKGLLLGDGAFGSMLGAAAGDGKLGGLLGLLTAGVGSQQGAAGGGFLDFLKKLFPFASGGMVTLAHLPRYAAGGPVAPDGGFPILAHPGEIILNRAQQANVAASLNSPSVTVHNYAAGVEVAPSVTRDEVSLMIRQNIGAYDRSASRGALDRLQDRQRRVS